MCPWQPLLEAVNKYRTKQLPPTIFFISQALPSSPLLPVHILCSLLLLLRFHLLDSLYTLSKLPTTIKTSWLASIIITRTVTGDSSLCHHV
jgi:hypothetical protein